MKIQLPQKKDQISPTIDLGQLVIIGANGSGKTRFGANIEERYNKQAHRISAQKSLSMPKRVGTKSLEVAQSELLYGGFMESSPQYYMDKSWRTRWQDNLNTSLLNDYEKLMVLLHTEEYESSLSYKENRIEKPITKLDRIQNIWESLLPHRKLVKKAGLIEAYSINSKSITYSGSELSDGERVIFYLIGEALCAPPNSIVIFDEPEMHIHKSLVKKLFDSIEAERMDCSFIYLTHDIDFAFSRSNAIKVWAKSYEGNGIWDYELLGDSPIPEQLYLEVLGSRKPVIFLEGDSSSIDYMIYEYVFKDYTIKPVGSCEKVIHSVKAFNEQNSFHHVISTGIIDRDRRVDLEIKALNKKGIWVLDVAEAENLLLIPDVVKILASHMLKDPEESLNQVKENVIKFFKVHLDSQILAHFKEALRIKFLALSNFTSKNINEVESEIENKYSEINKKEIFESIKHNFETIASKKDYDSILRIFNLKNALIPASKVCDLIGIRNKEEYLQLLIMKLKKSDDDTKLKSSIISKILMN